MTLISAALWFHIISSAAVATQSPMFIRQPTQEWLDPVTGLYLDITERTERA